MVNMKFQKAKRVLGLAGILALSGCGMAMGTVAGYQPTLGGAFMVASIGNAADNARLRREQTQTPPQRYDLGEGCYWTGRINSKNVIEGYGVYESKIWIYEGVAEDGEITGPGTLTFKNDGKQLRGYFHVSGDKHFLNREDYESYKRQISMQ